MTTATKSGWGMLTSHARALIAISDDPAIRIRDLAPALGQTERQAFTVICDLERAGYISRRRVGRRNEYDILVDLSWVGNMGHWGSLVEGRLTP